MFMCTCSGCCLGDARSGVGVYYTENGRWAGHCLIFVHVGVYSTRSWYGVLADLRHSLRTCKRTHHPLQRDTRSLLSFMVPPVVD